MKDQQQMMPNKGYDNDMTLAKWIPSFLGIPRNSQKFPTMQISLHQISLEFLRIFGNGKLGLTLGLEFLGILSFTILEA